MMRCLCRLAFRRGALTLDHLGLGSNTHKLNQIPPHSWKNHMQGTNDPTLLMARYTLLSILHQEEHNHRGFV